MWLRLNKNEDGGYLVEVYLDENQKCAYDTFKISPEDVKGETEQVVEEMAGEITKYSYFDTKEDRDNYSIIGKLKKLIKGTGPQTIRIGYCAGEEFYASKVQNETGTAILMHWAFSGDYTIAYVIPSNEFEDTGRLYEILQEWQKKNNYSNIITQKL